MCNHEGTQSVWRGCKDYEEEWLCLACGETFFHYVECNG